MHSFYEVRGVLIPHQQRDDGGKGTVMVVSFLMCVCLSHPGLFETLPGRVQCEMLLKATEQCFNTLEKAEMLLLLLKRFPESVVQHGVRRNDTALACWCLSLNVTSNFPLYV